MAGACFEEVERKQEPMVALCELVWVTSPCQERYSNQKSTGLFYFFPSIFLFHNMSNILFIIAKVFILFLICLI
jgi:hypothetical protein